MGLKQMPYVGPETLIKIHCYFVFFHFLAVFMDHMSNHTCQLGTCTASNLHGNLWALSCRLLRHAPAFSSNSSGYQALTYFMPFLQALPLQHMAHSHTVPIRQAHVSHRFQITLSMCCHKYQHNSTTLKGPQTLIAQQTPSSHP